MNQNYLYFPLASEQSYEQSMELIETLVAPCLIELADDFRAHCIHHIKVSSTDRSTWLMVMNNTKFASDPRTFLRIRLNGGIPALTESLKAKVMQAGGYVGDCSKQFINAQGGLVFNVLDGVDRVNISYGEVQDRFLAVGVEVGKELFEDESGDRLVRLFEDSVGFRLERDDSSGSTMYQMFFTPQSVTEYQSK